MKYNEQGVGINEGGGELFVYFVYFDPNDVNVSKLAYVRTKL